MEADTLQDLWKVALTVVTSLLTGVVFTSVLARRRTLERAGDKRARLADEFWKKVNQICVAIYPQGESPLTQDQLRRIHADIKDWYSEYGAYLTAEEDEWAR